MQRKVPVDDEKNEDVDDDDGGDVGRGERERAGALVRGGGAREAALRAGRDRQGRGPGSGKGRRQLLAQQAQRTCGAPRTRSAAGCRAAGEVVARSGDAVFVEKVAARAVGQVLRAKAEGVE